MSYHQLNDTKDQKDTKVQYFHLYRNGKTLKTGCQKKQISGVHFS